MIATYHVHSRWSDGKSSLSELVAAARAAGLGELGVSDHLALLPDGSVPRWSIDPARVGDYAADVRSFMGKGGLRVRLGIEMDWFEGRGGAIRATLRRHAFDYAIGSVHYIDPAAPNIDADPSFWESKPRAELDEGLRGYWRLVREMADSRLFQVAGHLDLPKKFGYESRADLGPLIAEAVDAVARAGMVVELNTSGGHKPCGEMYPSVNILRACRERGVPALLSSDAHTAAHLVRDFGRACEVLAEAGYSEVVRLGDEGFVSMPLAEVKADLKALYRR